MTLEQYFAILIKQWKLIIICSLFVGVGAVIGNKLMKPLYQSSTLVQVIIRSNNGNQAEYNNLMASVQLVQTEATLATSEPVLHEVASHYLGLTASQLAGEVSTTPKTNSQLFEIDIVDPSPTRAASLANDIATTLISQQQQQIEQSNAQAQQQIQHNIVLTNQQWDATTAKISAMQAKGASQGQIAILQAQLNEIDNIYSDWQAALAQLELTQAQNGNILRIAQPAEPAASSMRPSILLYTGVGLLAGLLLGMLLALLFERLDTRIRTPETLSQLLKWPILGTVWRVHPSTRENMLNPSSQDPNIESYRIIRTNIGFTSIDKPLHSLVVTSAMPGDGKSIIAANLAIFMARAGKQTLLIDADLHNPTQHTLFGLSADKMGLSNAILDYSTQSVPDTPTNRMPSIPKTPTFHQSVATASQGVDALTTTNQSLEPFIHAVDTPNLWVMPAGSLPPNPSELLDSKAMQGLLTVIANCGAEIVIFDTPSLLGLSDASILVSKVDGVLVVADLTRATKGKLKLLKTVLAKTGIPVLGCVANKHRRSRTDSVYSYYYYSQMEERNSNEKQSRNGQISLDPDTPLSSVSLSKFEQGKNSN